MLVFQPGTKVLTPYCSWYLALERDFSGLFMFFPANHHSNIDPYCSFVVPEVCSSLDKGTRCHVVGLYDRGSISLTRPLAGPRLGKFVVG